MKPTTLFRSISLTILAFGLVSSASAFGLSDLKAKASTAVAGQTELAGVLKMGQSLYGSFEGNAVATKYAKELMAKLQSGAYGQAIGYYEKIKSAGLTSEQLAAWNELKNPISAFILEQNFSDVEGAASDLVGKAVTALQQNELQDATGYLSRIKGAAQLSKEQAAVLKGIVANL